MIGFDPELQRLLHHRRVPQHRRGFFEELDAQLAELAPRRHILPSGGNRRLWIIPATVALIAAVLAGRTVLAGRDTPATTAEKTTSTTVAAASSAGIPLASDLMNQTAQALMTARSLQGSITEMTYSNAPSPDETHYVAFRASADGSYWMRRDNKGADDVTERSYDAASGAMRALDTVGTTVDKAEITTEGPADVTQKLGAFLVLSPSIRSLISSEEPKIKAATFDDRSAWTMTINDIPASFNADDATSGALSSDSYTLTVDKETKIPVHLVGTKNDVVREEYFIKNLVLDDELSTDDLIVQFPKTAAVTDLRGRGGYRFVEKSAVKAIVGYAPYVPTYVPDGWQIAHIVVRSASSGSDVTTPGDVVAISYRKGFETFVVTTAFTSPSSGAANAAWNKAHSLTEKTNDGYSVVGLLGQGGFTDAAAVVATEATANVLTAAGSINGDNALLRVSGDLSRDELTKIAKSLRQ